MITESRVPVNKPMPLSGLITRENKTHPNRASEITLFSLWAKQVHLSHVLYKSHKFCQAFLNSMEQLSGNQINQDQTSQSVLHHRGRGEEDVLGAGKAPGECGAGWGSAGWLQSSEPGKSPQLFQAGSVLRPIAGGSPCAWMNGGNAAQRSLCSSCSRSGSSSLIYYSDNGQPAKDENNQKEWSVSTLKWFFTVVL